MFYPNLLLKWNPFSIIWSSGILITIYLLQIYFWLNCIWILCSSSNTLLLEWDLIFYTFMPFYLNGTPFLPSFHVTICSFFKIPLTIPLLYTGFPELPPTWVSITMGMLEHVPFHYIFVAYLIWHHWDNPKWLPSRGSWTIMCLCICIKDVFGGAYFPQAHKALGAHKSPAKLINRWAPELRAGRGNITVRRLLPDGNDNHSAVPWGDGP